MKSLRLFFSILFLFSNIVLAESLYDAVYKVKTPNLNSHFKQQLKPLYNEDEEKREKSFENFKKAAGQSKRQSDRMIPFTILTQFVLGMELPKKFKSDEDYMEDLEDLQMEVLEYLIENVNNDELSTGDREYLMEQLALIATTIKSGNFDFIQKSVTAILEAGSSDSPVLRQTAMVAAKAFAIKSDEQWNDLAESSAELIGADLENSDTDLQRFSFSVSLDTIKIAQSKSEAIIHLWEVVAGNYEEITSPVLQSTVKTAIKSLIKTNSGDLFKDEIEEIKEALDDEESLRKLNKQPLAEIFEEIKDIDDLVELEAILDRLIILSQSDRVILYQIYQKLIEVSSSPEVSLFKLRLVNETIIKMTHNTNSPLFFYRSAMVFLSEIAQFGNSIKSQIPLTMLDSLLSSTEYIQLTKPVLEEIKIFLNFPLPIWVKRRLVTNIYTQAGNSPNPEVAETALKILITIADEHDAIALRFDALNRIQQLVKFSSTKSVKAQSNKWLRGN